MQAVYLPNKKWGCSRQDSLSSDPATYRKKGVTPEASAVLMPWCKDCHLPGLQHIMGSLA